jgi:hypothetical protein
MVRQEIPDSKLLNPQMVPAFARHETFHPRFGWLTKGFDQAIEDPEIFLREDAAVKLGVGKNMVRSIRYWCTAFKILKDGRQIQPSELGANLLSATEGWDRYLEDPASLWWLHWHLLRQDALSPCHATAWYFVFNVFKGVEFTADDLFYAMCQYREQNGWNLADSSLRKDVTCILRMYVEQRPKAGPTEDSIDCPFAELGIIHAIGDGKSYTFRIGPKRNLPAEIIVAACLDYIAQGRDESGTIAVSRLLFEEGSPGMVFKLSESAVTDAIEKVSKTVKKIQLSDSAGLIQLSHLDIPSQLSTDILNTYYKAQRGEAS